jgi:glycosyltransferase involved in cell wall biosynthesis
MIYSRKILIFSTAYYPFVGGAEVAIKEITDRLGNTELTQNQFEFDLITAKMRSDLPSVEKVGNVIVYRLGIGIPIIDKLILPFWGALKALQLNKKNNYDKFWCMMVSFASGSAYLANIFIDFLKLFGNENLSSSVRVPIILSLQEGDSEEYLKTKWFGLIDLAWRLALQRSDVVTVISNYLGERARRLGFAGEPVLIPNGVDVDRYSEIFSEEELNELGEKLGRDNENMIMLISTSRLNVKNGLDLVIKALPNLPENIHFYNFGAGEEKKYLNDLASSLGVSSRVHLEEYVNHDELPKYLKIANIFIRPSRSEGQGISFLEAMAVRLPVIATPVGGIVDFLFDPSNSSGQATTGYFCQPENSESIAEVVQKVINDPNKNQITENAYKMVVEKYDWKLIAKKMQIIFEKNNE